MELTAYLLFIPIFLHVPFLVQKTISLPLASFSGHIRSVNPSQPIQLRKELLLFLAVPERILKQ
jgi:membrane protein insertase Oxa1/YidC/SpoIIIJ